jgi:hypothetical protein
VTTYDTVFLNDMTLPHYPMTLADNGYQHRCPLIRVEDQIIRLKSGILGRGIETAVSFRATNEAPEQAHELEGWKQVSCIHTAQPFPHII